MKILVCITQAPDTTSKIAFTDNNTRFSEQGVTYIINPYDEWYALVRALELKESSKATEICLITIGNQSTEAIIRKALALGGDAAVRVNMDSADPYAIATQIAAYAKENNFIPALKIVRGAYMEKENRRAEEMSYPTPINTTKQATDDEYNAALEFCINPENNISVVIGSHNEYSNLLGVQLMERYGLPHDDKRVHFSQLYGMSDNITFNLAKAGCLVSKYLPFGPIKDVIPYLMRRAQENSSVSGQTGRELLLIKKELKRRAAKEN